MKNELGPSLFRQLLANDRLYDEGEGDRFCRPQRVLQDGVKRLEIVFVVFEKTRRTCFGVFSPLYSIRTASTRKAQESDFVELDAFYKMAQSDRRLCSWFPRKSAQRVLGFWAPPPLRGVEGAAATRGKGSPRRALQDAKNRDRFG